MAAIIKETPTACINTCHYLEHIITHDTTKGDLTAASGKHYTCRAGAIVPAELGNSETQSGRKPAFMSAAFFVSVAHFTLWWIVRGGASLLGSLGSSFPTSHGLPPVIGNSDGRYNLPKGANIMANQQAKSAHSSTNTTKSNTVPLNMADALNQMRIFGLDIRALQVDTAHPVRCRACGEQGRRGWYMLHATPMQTGGLLLIGTYGIWRGDVNDMRRVLIPAQFLKAVHA